MSEVVPFFYEFFLIYRIEAHLCCLGAGIVRKIHLFLILG